MVDYNVFKIIVFQILKEFERKFNLNLQLENKFNQEIIEKISKEAYREIRENNIYKKDFYIVAIKERGKIDIKFYKIVLQLKDDYLESNLISYDNLFELKSFISLNIGG